ncbi:MAG: HNH endonuclease [Thermodesulfobacteriota bacterium]|nr:HNH endonuclease [Thermodesulfobacteriota bacterium]
MKDTFIIQFGAEEIKKEREKAKALRKTRWWNQRLARGLCHYCRRHFPPAELTMDHIVPLIRGGKTAKGNVAAVCKECNSKKKYLLPMEWDAYLQDTFGKEEG